MTAGPLRAPATDGGVLVDPSPPLVAEAIADNARQLAAWDHDLQGRRATWLRSAVRSELIAAATEFLARHQIASPPFDLDALGTGERPLIVTGHQPELFHPGVWIKNFAVASIAQATGGTSLNLIVDNDIPKSSSIAVPFKSAAGLRTTRVDFDRWGGDVPFEDARVLDEDEFAIFAERVKTTLGRIQPHPLIDEFWPRVLKRRDDVATHGLRFSLARRELEASWGVHNLEIPMSAVCESDGFYWFVSHLLAQLDRYIHVHNEALSEYRTAHGIRSKNHPVAALARQGEWLEAPFWVWRAEHPRRRALLIRQRRRAMDLRIAGEDEILLELPLSPDREACCAVERLRELPGRSVRLRTRALTTTLFSRFLLSDLFIHGIGGAKYDELGDEVARRFFGIEPPRFLTVSMTLWPGLSTEEKPALDPAALQRQLRDLQFNPDRHLSEPLDDEVRRLVRTKHQAIAGPVATREQRRIRRREILRCNDALQPLVREERDRLLTLRRLAQQQSRSNRIVRNREFSFVLHPEGRLKKCMLERSWGWTDLSESARLSPADVRP